jgi:hypothetical protein
MGHDDIRALDIEYRPAGQQLVENAAQRIEI